MNYETQTRCYNMTIDVGDHGMQSNAPILEFGLATDSHGNVTGVRWPKNVHGGPSLCSCGNAKLADRTYCFPCTDLIDDGCALGD